MAVSIQSLQSYDMPNRMIFNVYIDMADTSDRIQMQLTPTLSS